ncbi:Asp/Glu/hydantoin racemase [Azorhizobium oxalatiphilum]|uniref:Asp/Glu/hydantoin racemase n=1 Tax=Azorhizobium oxalatiphilum TaxID=980631 RepID=A0A917BZI0_9HYPH|nr:aspartate/glutamate racemase family protein [Azorhizobium oxalatiphilum]GGF62792.1 Asp/Glu/hydantoin racemase [Azorhizobium oxalatiphilum]
MNTPGPILVINPNSDTLVTDALSRAVEPFRLGGGPAIECATIAESPLGIITQRDVAESGLRTADLAAARPDASAIIIACYSQPGLDLLRAETKRPVIGMQDAGVLAALGLADRFGVIAVAEGSIPRHLNNLARMGVMSRLAGEVAPSRPITVAESGDPKASFDLLLEAGNRLKEKGAGAIVLGCAGMSPQRGILEDALGIPVVDAVQAAVTQALGRVLVGA